MSASLFDNPLFSELVGDREVQQLFSPEADIAAMLDFEAALANAQAAYREIDESDARAIVEVAEAFKPDIAALAAGAARDGMIVPALVKALREKLDEPQRASLHKGATSQDLIDTSLAVRLGHVFTLFEQRLAEIEDALSVIAENSGEREIMGVTRMRAAIPIQLSHRLSEWRRPLAECRIRAGGVRKLVCVLHLGGAVGDRRDIGKEKLDIANHMAAALDLGFDSTRRQSSRGWVADTGHWFALVSGSLGKMAQDIVLMAQDGVGQVRLTEGGGSSAMAHKVNPVAAEVVIALARFNATQIAGLHQAMIHEMERSGAAWALEWMILPQMAAASGAALLLSKRILETTDFGA
ncbi:MAG: 3-carboxy-cis,cis-muconate cycloisomerase [Rhodobiaceae bacterium]|nr:3-carboxy-cis,cis-muconate cycloisomerase [Rhodobiaceae bacterium]MCC0055176.1 3-carboxy-cis,cis-muconate cycloisomerase [Rhodobiaceae bacterium]